MPDEKKVDPKKQALDNAHRIAERAERSVHILQQHLGGIKSENHRYDLLTDDRRIPMFHVEAARALLGEIGSDMGDLTVLANQL
jgi:hypothetical protein